MLAHELRAAAENVSRVLDCPAADQDFGGWRVSPLALYSIGLLSLGPTAVRIHSAPSPMATFFSARLQPRFQASRRDVAKVLGRLEGADVARGIRITGWRNPPRPRWSA